LLQKTDERFFMTLYVCHLIEKEELSNPFNHAADHLNSYPGILQIAWQYI